ncbi:hypothetical protein HK099_006822, partial [Clydaea vesicula]
MSNDAESLKFKKEPTPWKRSLYKFMNPNYYTRNFTFSKFVFYFFGVVLLISIANILLMTVPSVTNKPKNQRSLFIVDSICFFIFIIEFILNCLAAPNLKSMLHVIYLIDLASILSFTIECSVSYATYGPEGFLSNTFSAQGTSFIWFLRMIRVVRIFRILRMSSKLRLLARAVKGSLNGIIVLISLFPLMIIFFATGLYFAERTGSIWSQDHWRYLPEYGGDVSPFQSIPDCFWLTIVTLTTVGYGDAIPKTLIGRMAIASTMVASIFIVAFPLTMITIQYAQVVKASVQKQRRREHESKIRSESTSDYAKKKLYPSNFRKIPIKKFIRSLGNQSNDNKDFNESKLDSFSNENYLQNYYRTSTFSSIIDKNKSDSDLQNLNLPEITCTKESFTETYPITFEEKINEMNDGGEKKSKKSKSNLNINTQVKRKNKMFENKVVGVENRRDSNIEKSSFFSSTNGSQVNINASLASDSDFNTSTSQILTPQTCSNHDINAASFLKKSSKNCSENQTFTYNVGTQQLTVNEYGDVIEGNSLPYSEKNKKGISISDMEFEVDETLDGIPDLVEFHFSNWKLDSVEDKEKLSLTLRIDSQKKYEDLLLAGTTNLDLCSVFKIYKKVNCNSIRIFLTKKSFSDFSNKKDSDEVARDIFCHLDGINFNINQSKTSINLNQKKKFVEKEKLYKKELGAKTWDRDKILDLVTKSYKIRNFVPEKDQEFIDVISEFGKKRTTAEVVIKHYKEKKLEGYVFTQDALTSYLNFLVKAGEETEVCSVFNSIKFPSKYNYNAMMSYYSKQNNYPEALYYFKKLEKSGLKFNEVTYNTMIVASKSQPNSDVLAEYYFNKLKKRHFKANSSTYNSLITVSLYSENFIKAEFYYDEMKRNGYTPSQLTFNILINAFDKAAIYDKIDFYLQEMQQFNMLPDIAIYTILINSALKRKNMDMVRFYFNEMSKNEVKPDINAYNSFLQTSLKNKDFNYVELFFDQLKLSGLPSSAFTYNILINAAMEEGDLHKTEGYVRDFLRSKLRMNSVIATTLIRAYTEMSNFQKVDELFLYIKKEQIVPNLRTYNALLYACVASGNSKKGNFYLQELRTKKLKPDSYTYSNILRMHANNNDMESMENCLKELYNNKINLDLVLYSAILSSYTQLYEHDKVLSTFQKIKSSGLQCNSEIYNHVIKSCIKVEAFDKIQLFIQDMESNKITPDIHLYNSLISACSRSGDIDKIEVYREKMKSFKVSPNLFTYNTLISAFVETDYDKATTFLKELMLKGFRPSIQTYNIYFFSNPDIDLDTLFDRMEKFRLLSVKPNVTTWVSIINAFKKANQGEICLKIFKTLTNCLNNYESELKLPLEIDNKLIDLDFHQNNVLFSVIFDICKLFRYKEELDFFWNKIILKNDYLDSNVLTSYLEALLSFNETKTALDSFKLGLEKNKKNKSKNGYFSNIPHPNKKTFLNLCNVLKNQGESHLIPTVENLYYN